MTSGTYGTLQGDASPSPPKSYRLSKVAKIALALIVCGAAAVTSTPARSTITRLLQDRFSALGWGEELKRSARNPQDGKLTVAEVIEDLQDRVVNIEKYLQATSDSGGSGNSRGTVMMPVVLGMMARGHGARRRLKDQDAGGSGTSRAMDTYNGLLSIFSGPRSGGAASTLKDQIQDLQGRVAAIEKYLQAAGGSGNSRGRLTQGQWVYVGGEGSGR